MKFPGETNRSRRFVNLLIPIELGCYLPPPAQAQAHPAQAQAQAQAHPPPPHEPLLEELDVYFGAGLVTEVIFEVKSVIFPTTFDENVCTRLTTNAAKSDPGTLGLAEGAALVLGVKERPTAGSYRPHQTGMSTGWLRKIYACDHHILDQAWSIP